MTSENHGHWPRISAERLRKLQSSSAHLPDTRRRDYLRSELRKAVEELPESERAAHLAALAEQFPVEGSAAPNSATGTDTPAQCLEQLRRSLETLEGPAADEFAARARELLDARPSPNKPPPLPSGGDLHGLLRYDAEQLPHLQLALTVLKSGKLQSNSPGALELLNLVKTAALLIETFGGIEAVFWKVWAAAAPKSTLQEPFAEGYLAETARLLEGKPGASFAAYSRSVSLSGQLLVALLSAIPSALERLSAEWLDQFAPERIAAEVRRTERGPLGGAPEQRFWREYEYRCADFTPARLAEGFFRHLSESASSIIASQRGTSP